jgi:hypothetical protein
MPHPDAIFVRLDLADFRRLVADLPVIHSVGGQVVYVQFEGLSARDAIQAVIDVMGDDPPEASEYLRSRGKNDG